MEIQHFNRESKGHFAVVIDGQKAATMTYSWAGVDKFIIDTTTVDPAFKGQSLGKKMLMEAVKYAREKNIKILPLCPFAKSVFDKDKDIQDVLF